MFLNVNDCLIDYSDIDYIRNIKLDIETLHLPYRNQKININYLWENNLNANICLDELSKNIVFASKSSIPIVVLHASSGFAPPSITVEGLNNFKRVATICEKESVKLVIENNKKTNYVIALIENLKDYNVGFCFDVGHANAFTHNLFDSVWNSALTKLECVHLHDNNGLIDSHLMPGMGTINFDELMEKLLIYNSRINFSMELYYKGRELFYDNINEQEFYNLAYKCASKVLGECCSE